MNDMIITSIIGVGGTLLGTIFGAYLTRLSSNSLWEKEKNYQLRNIAKGLFYEVEGLDNLISLIVNEYKSKNLILQHYNSLYDVISQKIEDPTKFRLLQENMLYYIFRKEIYQYDEELIENILIFYDGLKEADIVFQNYLKLHPSKQKFTSNNDWVGEMCKLQEEFIKQLDKISSVVSDLKKLLIIIGDEQTK